MPAGTGDALGGTSPMTKHDRLFRHEHAHKLEDPERLTWLPPDAVVARLHVSAGARVADVGAGTGYFALPLARAVVPSGRVFAIDLQPEMLAHLRGKLAPELPVTVLAGSAEKLPLDDATVDLAFYANVWHEIDDRGAALSEAARVLAPGGRLAIVDWRADVAQPPGPPLAHRIAEADVAGELRAGGWTVEPPEHVGTYSYLVLASRAG